MSNIHNLVLFCSVLVFFPLQRQNPKDVHTLAQLISAYSLVDPEKAKVYPFNGGERGVWVLLPWIFSCVGTSDPFLPEERQGPSLEQLRIWVKLSGVTLFL